MLGFIKSSVIQDAYRIDSAYFLVIKYLVIKCLAFRDWYAKYIAIFPNTLRSVFPRVSYYAHRLSVGGLSALPQPNQYLPAVIFQKIMALILVVTTIDSHPTLTIQNYKSGAIYNVN
jgi:hypothetical protein